MTRHTRKIYLIIIVSLFIALSFAHGKSANDDSAKVTPTPVEKTDSSEANDTFSPVLDATTRASTRYLPVKFSTHNKHMKWVKTGCVTCHHDITNGDNEPNSCSSCHNKTGAKVDLVEAMHKSCKGCHLKIKARSPKTKAPTTCLECHTERK